MESFFTFIINIATVVAEWASWLLMQILGSNLLPTVALSIGLGLIAILTPVVLFLFSREGELTLFEWDKIVILDNVIRARRLLIATAFLFLPFLLWDFDSYLLKIVLLVVFFLAVAFFVTVLINSYKWIKTIEIPGRHPSDSYRSKLRNDYLDKVDNLMEKEKVWALTWRRDITNIQDERNFVNKFILNLDALIQTDSLDILASYLRTFHEFIEKRALYDWVIFGDFFSKLLEWHFKLYPITEGATAEDRKVKVSYHEVHATITHLLGKFVASGLQKPTAYLLFKHLETHAKCKRPEYLQRLLIRNVCRTLFDNVADSPESNDIWEHYFPAEWKITKETIGDNNNIVSNIWFHEFFQWARPGIWTGEKDFDKNLDEVARELFPEVDPILWADILTLVMRPWADDQRMKSLVEQPPNFGFRSRLYFFWSLSDDELRRRVDARWQSEEKRAIELALLLFQPILSEDNLNKYINELNRLKCEDGSREERRKKHYISLFEEMKNS